MYSVKCTSLHLNYIKTHIFFTQIFFIVFIIDPKKPIYFFIFHL